MKSTDQEIAEAQALVKATEARIEELVQQEKKVHIIWDFDFVLASGLSDDVFNLTGYNLEKYFEYEARLCWNSPENGIWLSLATSVGRLHHSQDIVTARSSYLAFRVMYFCLMKSSDPNWVRWMLFLGHQTKSDSFRIILESFKKTPDTHIFFIDDAKKHVDSFLATGEMLGMSERIVGIVSPQIRFYTKEELEAHYNAVMGATGDKPVIVPHYKNGYGGFTVLPNGLRGFRGEAMGITVQLHKEAVVENLKDLLEADHERMWPGQPKTIDSLYALFEIMREPR